MNTSFHNMKIQKITILFLAISMVLLSSRISLAQTPNIDNADINNQNINSPEKEKTYDVAVSSYFRKGLELASDAKFEEAEAEFNKAFGLDHSDPDINAALSMLADVRKGAMTKDFAANFFRGFLYSLLGDYQKAAAFLEKAWLINPKDADVNYNLGVAYYSLKDYQKAIDYFLTVVKLQPEDANAYAYLGNAYYFSGQRQEAKENLSKAKTLFQESNDQEHAAEIDKLLEKIAFADLKA